MWNNDGAFGDGGNTGGGFINSPSQFSSPQVKKERKSQNVVPVTVRQINESQEDTLTVEGSEVHMLVIVGVIRRVEVSSTKIIYKIDDSTGIIEGVQWLQSDSEMSQEGQNPLVEFSYCRVVGTLKQHQGKKNLMIFNISPITDTNRITTHILEVMHDHMKLQMINSMKQNGGAAANQSMMASASNGQQQQGDDRPMIGGAGGGNDLGLTGTNRVIFQIIRMCKDEIGISKQEVFDKLEGKVPQHVLEQTLDHLSSEGIIFCSIDEDHFKTSENF